MNARGTEAEEAACKFLKEKGYKILARNYSAPAGEIDIIAAHKDTLVFVEVKARAGASFGGPLAAVTQAKQRKIANTAVLYIKEKGLKYSNIRFDVAAVIQNNIEHIENAFTPLRFTI